MRAQPSRTPSAQTPDRNIGTLWTLQRGESAARCVLFKVESGLELRVMMDGSRLRAERCATHQESFELAARWRDRMAARGWQPIVRPSPAVPPAC